MLVLLGFQTLIVDASTRRAGSRTPEHWLGRAWKVRESLLFVLHPLFLGFPLSFAVRLDVSLRP